ncbi:23S rRNA (guanosine(2251)-2'-O)-methyltransferase RlmB [Hyphomicrobium methylovorum]|uniref:23S rRNA (guanosine(2251)-2'-O)-methyltransferase RlmB n=1 Tax=Hyphomicrobium methylovorum TaxID=84 RepID=UPI0015E65D25|nr:23S rRNA (guanosine(2251)-2'-O)-methyltransferase RlmB [Hyphomicrobium methylovorum]MBA2127414.1 23S rRNA (guanosine(2251)-2'-O)-methyltransferase RlmB [Hyphomicrobium methylovorum]
MSRRHPVLSRFSALLGPPERAGVPKAAHSSARSALSNERFKKPWREKKRFSSRLERARGAASGGKPQRHGAPGEQGSAGHDGPLELFGLHAVEAALRNPARRAHRLLLTENAERRLIEALGAISPPIERVTPRDLDRRLGADTVHQGVLLETEPLPEPHFEDLAKDANARPLIVLDQVTDPHNVGAILRSASVFGASGLVMTRRHSPPLNGVLAKSASGALELVPVALVANLARALDELKEAGFTVLGLDGEAEQSIADADWSRPTAIVMGAEGKGLRELTRKTCDSLVRIPQDGQLASLNVSNAAAVALYAAMASRQQRTKA